MKFLSSSSSSTSSTTTTTSTSFHQKICNSKSGTHGCLAGKLRRLLCFNSISKYHSDQILDSDMNSVELDKLRNFETDNKIEFEPTANLGIVARLMGLESTPSIDSGNTQMIPNSNSRSQSMKSDDSCQEFETKQGRLRRVKEEDFFVLSFGNLGENKELWKLKKSSNSGFRESKPKRKDKCRNKNGRRESVYVKNDKENQVPNNVDSNSIEKLIKKMNYRHSQKISNNGKVRDFGVYVHSTEKNYNGNSCVAVQNSKQSKSRDHKQNSNGGKLRTVKKKENCPLATKVEIENSSPVSVLDLSEFAIKPQVSTSATEEDLRLTRSSSMRNLSTKLVNYEQLSPSKANNSKTDDQEAKITEGRCYCPMKSYSIYRNMWKHEDFEDICPDLGLHIFEELLNEFVDQLIEFQQQKI